MDSNFGTGQLIGFLMGRYSQMEFAEWTYKAFPGEKYSPFNMHSVSVASRFVMNFNRFLIRFFAESTDFTHSIVPSLCYVIPKS